ncbi:nitroreductase/quinone reductase family protein, partial [Escherichia coli]
MDAEIATALALTPASTVEQRTVDITTVGARTEQPRRIEIWFHNVNGEVYITGTPPRARSWYANLVAHP